MNSTDPKRASIQDSKAKELGADAAEAAVGAGHLTDVERIALESGAAELVVGRPQTIPAIVVNSFPELGKLAAMRFIEWVQGHPGGVIAMPTGKSPEHVIKIVTRILGNWDAYRGELERAGIDPATRPDNEIGLEAGQSLEDVWPGLKVDLSLRTRHATTKLEEIQQRQLYRIDDWCQRREEEIRDLGGIGFFLGGLGPDGHVCFNIRGSDHLSTTRLLGTNYETQAAAAGDGGGIEVVRCPAITIGLGTITFNQDCTAIIIAAGESKAGIVTNALIGESSVVRPASALRSLPNARFYLTRGAARELPARRIQQLSQLERSTDEEVERALVDLAVARDSRVLDLSAEDVRDDPITDAVLQKRREPLGDLAAMVEGRLIKKLRDGRRSYEKTSFLHTEPHHDDLLLGLIPYILRNCSGTNTHTVATLTSGFTSVSNQHMLQVIERVSPFLVTPNFRDLHSNGYFELENQDGRDEDVWLFLDGVAAANQELCNEALARRVTRDVLAIFSEVTLGEVVDRLVEVKHYLKAAYPGKQDLTHIQLLKGVLREMEAECSWGYLGWRPSHCIHHLRLKFYTGATFAPGPTIEHDVAPMVQLLNSVQPAVMTVAFDPEGSGPDTHYKVLQTVNQALQESGDGGQQPDVRIVGYRNVWHRFHASEANLFVPVTLGTLAFLENSFLNSFGSQRGASFPSFEHDGPFCELAQRIQVEQYQAIKTCLGREWFTRHENGEFRATRGLVFLREMGVDEFRKSARELRRNIETGDPAPMQ